ncbi:MAG: copper chaperone PCu(A)C [Xanthobacteraceae bacterium]
MDWDWASSSSSACSARYTRQSISCRHDILVQVSGGIAIAPGKDVTLAPGGLQVMFTDIKKPLKQGDKIPATVTFEKAGKVDVEFNVQAGGAGAPGTGHGSGHKM